MDHDQTLESARTWLEEYLALEDETRKLAFVPNRRPDFDGLRKRLSDAHAYDDRDGPLLPSYMGILLPHKADYAAALRPRTLFKLQLRMHSDGGNYVRAYVSGEVEGQDGYVNLWVLRRTATGEWRLTSSSNSCACGGLGTKDGVVHEDCDGIGWIWRGEGTRPPAPRGEVLAVLRLRRPERRPRQEQEYDSD